MARILIIPEKKQYVEDLKRTVTAVKQKIFFVTDATKPLHTTYGIIPASELQKPDGSTITTDHGKEFIIFTARFIDAYKRLRKLPQTIPLKDIGFIIAETGINTDSIVLDAGAGSGALAIALANIAKKVTTYEIRKDFLDNIHANIRALGLTNIEVKEKNVYEGFDETNADLITLDLPEPWKALPKATDAVTIGGFIITYSPSIPQVMDTIAVARNDPRLLIIKTVEQIERLWEFENRRVRPKSIEIGHSGFLTLIRRIRT